jgi:serine/threonine-protein kinase
VPPEPPTLATDDLLGSRYRLVSRIARGGMAEVWEAVDVVLDRPVAVKALLPHLAVDDAFVTRFRREAVAAARLSHPNIVATYDTCASDGCEAIVMELVRGRSLREVLDEGGALPAGRAVGIATQVASALDHAHRAGLVHRDVKPANILLADDGRVLVADFGIAKAAEASHDLTEVGEVMGTAKYLSPEQVQGDPVDARSDVYALGVVLYEMLCGRPPFAAANSTATAVARLTTDPLRPRQVRAGIPRQVEDIVLHALARDPDRRYESAGALRAALLAADVDGGDVDPTAAMRSEPPPAPAYAGSERSWWIPAALVVVIALTLGIVGTLVGRTDVGRELLDVVGGGDGGGGTDPTSPLALSSSSFDPLSRDREENDDTAALAHDGDPATHWTTEGYRSRALGGLKSGVGLVLALDGPHRLAGLDLESPTEGWAGQVYVGDGTETDLDAWGEPVAPLSGDGDRVHVDLGGLQGAAVLVWITDLGERVGDRFQFRLAEATVTGS